MSMSGGELKVLLALDKLAEVIPAYKSVHGAFRVFNDGGPTFEYYIQSNNTGLEFRMEQDGTGSVILYNRNDYRFDTPNVGLFLSPTLDFRQSLTFKEFFQDRINIVSMGITDATLSDAGFGYGIDPSANAYIHFELRIYPSI